MNFFRHCVSISYKVSIGIRKFSTKMSASELRFQKIVVHPKFRQFLYEIETQCIKEFVILLKMIQFEMLANFQHLQMPSLDTLNL